MTAANPSKSQRPPPLRSKNNPGSKLRVVRSKFMTDAFMFKAQEN